MKKNNFNRLFLMLSTVVFIHCCCYGQKEGYSRIEGSINGLKNEELILADERFIPIDTVKAVNGRFVFKHNLDNLSDPRRYLIYLPHIVSGSGIRGVLINFDHTPVTDKLFFFIDSKKIVINGEITKKNGLVGITIKGSPATDEYKALEAGFPSTPLIEKHNKLLSQISSILGGSDFGNKMFYLCNKKSSDHMQTLSTLSNAVRRKEMIDAIPGHNKSAALAYIVHDTFKDKDPSYILELKKALSRFDSELDTYYLRFLGEKLKKIEPAAVGALAPDFVLRDSTGTEFRMSTLRGNYVLLHFWTPKYPFYRELISHVDEAWLRFSDKGFKVLGVAFDTDKELWIDALRAVKPSYKQVLDENNSVLSQLYQSWGAGAYYVFIAPDGTIMENNFHRLVSKLPEDALVKRVGALYSE